MRPPPSTRIAAGHDASTSGSARSLYTMQGGITVPVATLASHQQKEGGPAAAAIPPSHVQGLYHPSMITLGMERSAQIVFPASGKVSVIQSEHDRSTMVVAMSPDPAVPIIAVGDTHAGRISIIHGPSELVCITRELGQHFPDFKLRGMVLSCAPAAVTGPSSKFELIVWSQHLVIRFYDLDLRAMCRAVDTRDHDTFSQIEASMGAELLVFPVRGAHRVGQCHTAVTSVIPIRPHDDLADIAPGHRHFSHLLVVGEGSNCMSLWTRGPNTSSANCVNCVSSSSLYSPIRQAHAAPNGIGLYTLDAAGHLAYWVITNSCRIRLLRQYGKPVEDFAVHALAAATAASTDPNIRVPSSHLVMVAQRRTSTKGDKLGRLRGEGENVGSPCIRLLDSRTFDEVARFDLPEMARVWLPATIAHAVVAKAPSAVNARSFAGAVVLPVVGLLTEMHNGAPCLQIREIIETQPRQQLRALMRNGDWTAALAFATQFGMDVQDVHEARVSAMLDAPITADQMLAAIQPVADTVIKCKVCLRAKCATLADVRRLLEAAKEYSTNALGALRNEAKSHGISAKSSRSDDETGSVAAVAKSQGPLDDDSAKRLLAQIAELEQLQNNVNDSMVRLGTWCLFNRPYQIDLWRRFMNEDLVVSAQAIAGFGFIRDLKLLWTRHGPVRDAIETIVTSIPLDVPSAKFIPWLQHDVFPATKPDATAALFKWLQSRAIAVEELPSRGPQEALRLIELILAAATPSTHLQTPLACFKYAMSVGSPAVPPETLRLAQLLRDIVDLHETHGYSISLAAYQNKSPEEIAMALLDRAVVPELLPMAVKEHFDPYVARHDLDRDMLLRDYCVQVLDERVAGASAQWESRVVTLLECLSSAQRRCTVIANLMTCVGVPWSDQVNTLIRGALALDPRASGTAAGSEMTAEDAPSPEQLSEIRGHYQRMLIRRMVQAYHITGFDVSNTWQARQLVKFFATRLDRTPLGGTGRAESPHSDRDRVPTLDPLADALQVAESYTSLSRSFVFETFLLHHAETRAPHVLRAYLDLLGQHPCRLEMAVAARAPAAYMVSLVDRATGATGSADAQPRTALARAPSARATRLELIENALALFGFVERHFGRAGVDLHAKTQAALVKAQRLQIELDLAAPLGKLKSEEACLALFKVTVETWRASVTHGDEDGSTMQLAIGQLADILAIPTPTARLYLIRHALQERNVAEAVLLVQTCIQEEVALDVHVVMQDFASFMVSNPRFVTSDLVTSLTALAQYSVLYVEERQLPATLDLYRLVALQQIVFDLTELGDYGQHLRASAARTADVETSAAASNAGRPGSPHLPVELFPHQYDSDSGLVLDPVAAIPPCARLIQRGLEALAAIHPQSLLTKLGHSRKKNKGRQVDPMATLQEAVNDVSRLLARARHFQTRLHLGATFAEMMTRLVLDGTREIDALMHLQQQLRVVDGTREVCQTLAGARSLDMALIFGHLLELGSVESMRVVQEWLGGVLGNFSKSHVLCSIGIACGTFWQHRAAIAFFLDYIAITTWTEQLSLLDIPFRQGDFNDETDRHTKLLEYVPPLLDKTGLDLLVALEFARQFKIDEDLVLIMYIQQQLKYGRSRNASSTNSDNALGADCGSSAPTSANYEYQNAIAGVHGEVLRKKLLAGVYMAAFNHSDPHDYDKIQFICGQLADVATHEGVDMSRDQIHSFMLARTVLEVIRSFKKPAVGELAAVVAEDVRVAHENGWDVEWAAERVQLHALCHSPWATIRRYLCPATVDQLLPIGAVFKLDPDTIFGQLVTQITAQKGSTLRFADVRPYLRQMRGSMAFSVAKMVGETTRGKDKVQALRFALQSLETSPLPSPDVTAEAAAARQSVTDRVGGPMVNQEHDMSDAKRLLMVKALLNRAELECLLEDQHLDEYLPLVTQQDVLIELLYRNYRAIQQRPSVTMTVHELTAQIAAKCAINIQIFRRQLYKKFLNAEEVLVEGQLPSATFHKSGWAHHDVILRLLDTAPRQEMIKELLEIAYDRNSARKSHVRIRALSIVLKFAEPEELKQVPITRVKLRRSLRGFLHFRDCQYLDIPHTSKDLGNCNKALLQSLWYSSRSHAKYPLVLHLICNLSLDYSICDDTLMKQCLTDLLRHQQHSYLLANLGMLSKLYGNPSWMLIVWNQLLHAAVAHPTPASTDAIAWFDSIHEALVSCPVASSLFPIADSDDNEGSVSTEPNPRTNGGAHPPLAEALLDMAWSRVSVAAGLVLLAAMPMSEARAVAAMDRARLEPADVARAVVVLPERDRVEDVQRHVFAYALAKDAAAEVAEAAPSLVPAFFEHCLARNVLYDVVQEAVVSNRLTFAETFAQIFTKHQGWEVPEGQSHLQVALAQFAAAAAAPADTDQGDGVPNAGANGVDGNWPSSEGQGGAILAPRADQGDPMGDSRALP
ncbi:hypothetical protein AMAG_06235 [Allomyces macrogynus ATCC 38327]|uniref:Uncharacterized protein n=1 Tax=Allomyces macrogynus (strain ATCC 38327) TaxID=578462 RepID=A0A0L0SG87_ALLM3|nr:hypothetical protein AMAG_06235 [Allomyces macrogynus ATCC 38327]|eukprot:KNE61405.1 hypothetical protein AMAG_06235 [Allomyces macrogynus ATCC 38327]